jgi:hypothetical protein
MEKKVLTQEEIQSLKKLQANQANIITALGSVEYQLEVLTLQKQNLKIELQKQLEEETKTSEELSKKYGEGNIDLEKGEIIILP